MVSEGSLSSIHGQAPSPAPPAAVPVVPLKLPLTYVSAQTQADQLELNADNSFSLQEAGQTYHGMFSLTGNTLELRISETNANTTATMQGSTLIDGSGQTWVLREQPVLPTPGADVVKNQDVIRLVKAGLDDEIVIAKIGSSRCQFDTSPVALIGLAQSGVSAAVIKTMVAIGAPAAADTPPSPPAAAPSVQPPAGPTLVTGRVVWDGIPVPNALVQLWQSGDHNSSFKLVSTASAADGTFTMREPPTGRLRIGAVGPSPDYGGNHLLYPVTIVAGQRKNVGDLYVFKKLQLLSPANSATITTTTPTLQWTGFPGAARYDVRVFNSKTQQLVLSQSTQSTQIKVSPGLPGGQQYQWDVGAYGSRTMSTADSSTWYFTIPSTVADTAAGPPGQKSQAPSATELAAPKPLGERNYIDIKLGKTKKPQRFGDITLLLKDVDVKTNTYTVEVMADDKITEKRDKRINEPVQFYTSRGGRLPYELVINTVGKNEIVGYLSTPKETVAR